MVVKTHRTDDDPLNNHQFIKGIEENYIAKENQ